MRRNLLAFATIAIAFGWWHLSLSSSPTLFGVQLQNLSSDVVAWALLWTVLYLLVHFVWLAWDALQEWRLRQTGTRVTAVTVARAGSDLGDYPSDPRQSTLYGWWRDQRLHLAHSKKVADETLETVRPWIENGLPGEVSDETKARFLTIGTNVAELQSAVEHAAKVLDSHRPYVSLDRFDTAYRRFLRSQNLRWITVEFGVPLLVGVGGLVACLLMICEPVKPPVVQPVPVVLAPVASSPASPSASRASTAAAAVSASTPAPLTVAAKPVSDAASK